MTSQYIILLYLLSIIYIAISPFISITFIDEVIVLILAVYAIKFQVFKLKEVKIFLFSFLFFLSYSLIVSKNRIEATLLDFVLFTKPFICFYVTSKINISNDKNKYRFISIILGILAWIYLPFINDIYTNTTAFYPLCLFSATSYLLFSPQSSKDKFIALLFLIPGLFTMRAKFFAEFIMYIYIFYFIGKKINISFKNSFLFFCAIIIILYMVWDKIIFYFITGYEDGLARTMLYYTSIKVLVDYFPFGSGFGTFGTESAARFYSPLYYEYGLDSILGLRPEDYRTAYNFFCDTFYPILAQFGIIGIYLYFKFWSRRFKENKRINSGFESKLFLFLFLTMTIQNIADNTFTGPLSLPIMMSIGFLLSKKSIA